MGYLLPPSVDEWLPEHHLARFVVEVIEQPDLSSFVKAYRGSGSAAHHPNVLPGLLVRGHATGVFSSRKPERATYDSVAFRFIAANDHPDHATIAAFRRRFPDQVQGLFAEVLLLARGAGMSKPGTVALDGTRLHANASRHSALSWKHACEVEARLKAEVTELMALAEAADSADVPDGMSVPAELARREDRLTRTAEARAELRARAAERHAREHAEYEKKLRVREEKVKRTGRKPGGPLPAPPEAGPRPKDRVNLTDEDSRIMPVAGGGFEQCCNARATAAAGSLPVVAADVVRDTNDRQQITPALEALARLPEAPGTPETVLADSGCFSEASVDARADARVEPLISPGRERHHLSLADRFAEAPPAPEVPTPPEAMVHRLATPPGRALCALRKQTPRTIPCCGISDDRGRTGSSGIPGLRPDGLTGGLSARDSRGRTLSPARSASSLAFRWRAGRKGRWGDGSAGRAARHGGTAALRKRGSR